MKKKLKVLLLILLLIIPTTISGCGDVKQINDSLTIYVDRIYSGVNIYGKAITTFEKKYPDIKINLKEFEHADNGSMDYETSLKTHEEYYTQMFDDIRVGKGPDVIFFSHELCKQYDIYKLCKSNVFEDLTPYMEKDEDFKNGVFYDNVIKGLEMDEKQYLMPFNFTLPIYCSDNKILKENGVTIDNSIDLMSFTNILSEFKEKNPNKEAITAYDWEYLYSNIISTFGGYNTLDYINNEVDFNNEEYEKILENMYKVRPLGTRDYILNAEYQENLKGNILIPGYAYKVLQIQKRIGELNIFSLNNKSNKISAQYGYYNRTASIGAINKTSQNKEIAYNFIKCMMDEENQQIIDNIMYGFNSIFLPFQPVRKSSVDENLQKFKANGLITDKDIEKIKSYIEEINDGYINTLWQDNVKELLKPYEDGNQTLKACLDNIQQKMEIYITE